MTNCEYCDYYRLIGGSDTKKGNISALCLFTNVILFTDYSDTVMEYPCKDKSYREYIDRVKVGAVISKIRNENWKLIYKSKHPVAERTRSKPYRESAL